MPRAFVDTNLAVYAAVVPTQVLVEFAHTALTKLAMAPMVVRQQVALLASGERIVVDAEVVGAAIDLRTEQQVSFWDACILAAAEKAGCAVVYSEDLSSGRQYGHVRVVNPFLS